ncbi:LysM peptidoglycan-binding domain-containing protein [Salinicoccus hispanicus]|uniref:LysM peptidoglycan-binding domain-containing protein n=1 Tax=Salinicoccus hispanicus TaxID=157225 RepID=A0A6N8TYP2_9STAP|nr:LysM peptidoglycan-binding domain-containing protein [Salinicoccus hispanicus]MXQ51128.1 LysM peptidoglycan-binding domain-containing protein [Salinicoccus hispanicus]
MKKVLSVGAAIAVSGTLAYSAEAASHTVDTGDTLSQIAFENNTTVQSIKAENNLSSDLILPGQVLEVNNDEKAEKNTEVVAEDGVYTIVSGDTLFEIGQKFNVSVSNLKAWNNLSSDLIFAGKTLAVSGDNAVEQPVVEAPQVEEVEEVEEAPQVEEVQEVEEVQQAPAQPSQQQVAEQQAAAEQAAAEQRAAEQAAQEQAAAAQQAAEQAAAEQRAAEQAAQERQQRNQAQAQNQSTSASTSSNASGQNWGALAQCESSGNASVVSSNGLYHGLYQFDVQTWRSVGGSGVPSQASAAEQTKRAQILFDQRGSQPWPVCGSRL